MKQRTRAFTLIELLVVIVIIGILTTISTATFRSYQEKAKTAKAIAFSRQVYSEMSANVEDMYLRLNFEEGTGTNAVDLSGKRNDFTIGNNALWSTDTPHSNSNFSLATRTGGMSYPSYINQADVPRKDFTASFLVKIKESSLINDFMYYYWEPTGTDPYGEPRHGFHLTVRDTGNIVYSLGSYSDLSRIETGAKLENDKWYHILITRDTERQTMSLYINGEEIQTRSETTYARDMTPNQRLEIAPDPGVEDFLIDDLVFWGKPYRPE